MNPVLQMIEDVSFLALVVWREARGEPDEGQIAVACSIMNRVLRPSWWGDSVLAVVFKKWQYSSMTDPKDAQLTKWPDPKDPRWQRCLEIAYNVYMKQGPDPAPGADSYYADSIPAPAWADPKKFVCKIGAHNFFDLDSDHERKST